jgi:hypothetical protein
MIHTVVLKSTNFYGSQPADTSDVNYSMNWGFLKDNTKYKIRAFFNSKAGNFNANSIGLIYTDLLTSSNTYEPKGSNGGYFNSNYLTMIHPETVGHGANSTTHLQSHSVDSAYISINNKPTNSVFNVTIKNIDIDGSQFDMGNVSYTLVLQFQEL